jgi:RNA polymerase sigma-70 factor (ECF subfamily)
MEASMLSTATNYLCISDDIIRQIGNRDPNRAIELVVAKHGEAVYRQARYLLKDSHKGRDVAQEVFIKAMRETRFFDADFKMKAWLMRVTTNLCFNISRNQKRRRAILERSPFQTRSKATQTQIVFCRQAKDTLGRAIALLSPHHQEVLLLRYYEDLSYAEIANHLDLKLGTVMSRLSRAKEALARTLAQVAPGLTDYEKGAY